MSIYSDWAETYSNNGIKCIPCGPNKKPILSGWSKYCLESITDDEVKRWISQYPNAQGLGMPLGPANNIIVFDFDYDWSEKCLLSKEEFTIDREKCLTTINKLLPQSYCRKEGKPGKFSIFFKAGPNVKTISCLRNGITLFDILWDGRQTILPPSIHPETKAPYKWIGLPLEACIDDLPELDFKIIEHLIKELEIKIEGPTSSGGRNTHLKSFVFAQFFDGKKPEEILQAVVAYDKKKHSAPLFEDAREFNLKFKTANERAFEFITNNWNSFTQKNMKAAVKEKTPSDDDEQNDETKKYEQIGFYWRYRIPNEETGAIKIVDVAKYSLMAEHCFEQKDMCFDDSISLNYNSKYWQWYSKTALNNFIIEANKECIKPAHIDGFIKMIKGKCFINAMGFKPTDGLINVENGIVEAATGKITPHSKEHMFKYCVPVHYDKTQTCPLWLKFLDEVFEGNKDLIELVQRMFGYILIGGQPFLHKAFVLCGSGRNGKSTLLDILRAIIGKTSYSTVSMAKLDKEFSIVSIDGKLANIVEETPTDEINSEIFKTMVGGGVVQAAHKGFDEYSFKVSARFVFACNDMPVFRDKSIGLEDRLFFIPFQRYFKEDERDTEIIPKLMTELPGILNWAIDGAIKITEDHSMPNVEATIKLKETYKEETDPLYAWFKRTLTVTDSPPSPGYILIGDLYTRYTTACEENGHRPYSKDKFVKRLRNMITKICNDRHIKFDENFRTPRIAGKRHRAVNVVEYAKDED